MLATEVLAFGFGSPMEIGVVLLIALLLFGKRLPDVMRSMGRSVVEFKKGVQGIEDDIDREVSSTPVASRSSSEANQTKPTS